MPNGERDAATLRSLAQIKAEAERLGRLKHPIRERLEDRLDWIALFIAAVGLLLVKGAGVIGWVLAIVGFAVAAYDRLIRKPRQLADDEERRRSLDVIDHQVASLEAEIDRRRTD